MDRLLHRKQDLLFPGARAFPGLGFRIFPDITTNAYADESPTLTPLTGDFHECYSFAWTVQCQVRPGRGKRFYCDKHDIWPLVDGDNSVGEKWLDALRVLETEYFDALAPFSLTIQQ